MVEHDFPAGLWVLRQLDKEAKIQGTVLTAHDKWLLKQVPRTSLRTSDLTKRVVSLIRSSITRTKTSSSISVITINPQLTIPQDWFESYKTIFTSKDSSLLGECLQKAFKGCPEWGETEPWSSPEFAKTAKRTTPKTGESDTQPMYVTEETIYKVPNYVAGIALGSISVVVALIGGGALAVPFGIYGITNGNKILKSDASESLRGKGTIAITLGIIGITLGVFLFLARLVQ